MIPTRVSAVLVAIIVTVVSAACGGGGGGKAPAETAGGAAAGEAKPCCCDMGCSVRNITIEAPPADGAVRQYFAGLVARTGEVYDLGLLAVTQANAASSKSYEFAEYRTELANGEWLRRTTRSAGGVTTSDVQMPYGKAVVYRLDGGGSPAQARVFVKREVEGDVLNVPTDPANPKAGVEEGFGVNYAATATRGRVEVGEGLGEFPNWRVRLRVGDELVVRLRRLSDGIWSAKPESTGGRFQMQGERQDGSNQVFSFKVIQPGSAELQLEYRWVDTRNLVRTNTVRLDVE